MIPKSQKKAKLEPGKVKELRHNVLIVDNDIEPFAGKIIEHLGYGLEGHLCFGHEAADLAATGDYSLVILNGELEEIGGLSNVDVWHRIKDKNQEIPIIYARESLAAEEVAIAREIGVFMHVKSDVMSKKVNELIGEYIK